MRGSYFIIPKSKPMKATSTELDLLNRLQGCSCLPGSFDKKFPRSIDPTKLSPLQQWWIYKLGYKYRKQIGNDALAFICKTFIDSHDKPLSKREADKLLRKTAAAPC